MQLANSATQVLLAENDEEDVLFFRLALDSIPIPVALNVAKDGEMLMKLLNDIFPDYIFLDINMPYKNGRACLLEIRSRKELDEVPVIMITSYEYEGLVQDAFDGGANHYLIKPFNLADLIEALKAIFEPHPKILFSSRSRENFVLRFNTPQGRSA